jgi:hypothetical protein
MRLSKSGDNASDKCVPVAMRYADIEFMQCSYFGLAWLSTIIAWTDSNLSRERRDAVVLWWLQLNLASRRSIGTK